ncbi:hypothetical protein O7627_02140 [Solwaraspora sp. WMMD1047]|uniref:hypothetical protein n=1 Tax=Solwaraspora sp. WMMD1047 TaxID=3016102 RepID=UPI0024164755|nr:hypothetical protein [Solwaraspora sp. WMMD1047]MDG4828103.1 hypothetical protein [Solwaraspora sp. WMMD1047]
MRNVLAASAALSLLLAVPTGAAAAGPSDPSWSDEPAAVGIRLVDAPVSRRDDPRARLYIVDHLKPGEIIRRRVAVNNPSSQPQTISVYPGGGAVGKAGFQFAADREQNDLASWIRLDTQEVRLAPDESALVEVTLIVPPDATPGERYAVIWAESAGKLNKLTNVRNVGRAGVRVYLSVGPGGEPATDFDIGGLTGERRPDGVPVVSARVTNTGGRALDLVGELRLSDGPGKLSVDPVQIRVDKTVALDGEAVVSVPLDPALPDGRWTAELKLASGTTERRISGEVTFGGYRMDEATFHTGSRLAVGVVLSVLVLAALGGLAYRARHR